MAHNAPRARAWILRACAKPMKRLPNPPSHTPCARRQAKNAVIGGVQLATQAGALPIKDEPVRFAVGAPDGITSNSRKVWAKQSGVYIACRDNFTETKVSLHTSNDPHLPGRWRMGFTKESLQKIAHLRAQEENRAWEVWDEPAPSLPSGTVAAFRLVFPPQNWLYARNCERQRNGRR